MKKSRAQKKKTINVRKKTSIRKKTVSKTRSRTKKQIPSRTLSKSRSSQESLQKLILKDFERITKQKIARKLKPTPKKTSTKYSTILATSRKLGGDYLIKRARSRYDKTKKIKLNDKAPDRALKKLLPTLKKQFEAMGPSFNDLMFLRLGYTYQLNGQKMKSYYALPIRAVEDLESLKDYLRATVQAFASSLDKYLSLGFENITLDESILQSYEVA